jgi:Glycine-rich domain-containing protein-like
MEKVMTAQIDTADKSVLGNSLMLPLDDLDAAMVDVGKLDLTMVRRKIMDPEEGQGWDMEYAAHVEDRYRRFLVMIKVNPEGSSVPTQDIDLFWHQHILDTRAYARDCNEFFGYFLHHFPYFGMNGEEDERNLNTAFEETKRFYLEAFGADYTAPYAPSLDATRCHKCSNYCHKCSSGCGMKCTKCRSTS